MWTTKTKNDGLNGREFKKKIFIGWKSARMRLGEPNGK